MPLGRIYDTPTLQFLGLRLHMSIGNGRAKATPAEVIEIIGEKWAGTLEVWTLPVSGQPLLLFWTERSYAVQGPELGHLSIRKLDALPSEEACIDRPSTGSEERQGSANCRQQDPAQWIWGAQEGTQQCKDRQKGSRDWGPQAHDQEYSCKPRERLK